MVTATKKHAEPREQYAAFPPREELTAEIRKLAAEIRTVEQSVDRHRVQKLNELQVKITLAREKLREHDAIAEQIESHAPASIRAEVAVARRLAGAGDTRKKIQNLRIEISELERLLSAWDNPSGIDPYRETLAIYCQHKLPQGLSPKDWKSPLDMEALGKHVDEVRLKTLPALLQQRDELEVAWEREIAAVEKPLRDWLNNETP